MNNELYIRKQRNCQNLCRRSGFSSLLGTDNAKIGALAVFAVPLERIMMLTLLSVPNWCIGFKVWLFGRFVSDPADNKIGAKRRKRYLKDSAKIYADITKTPLLFGVFMVKLAKNLRTPCLRDILPSMVRIDASKSAPKALHFLL